MRMVYGNNLLDAVKERSVDSYERLYNEILRLFQLKKSSKA